MKNAINLNIHGIKCDACDYKNDDVKFEEYKEWLNKPCPKCGTNLLTQADLNSTKKLIKLTNIINKIIPKRKDDEQMIKAEVKMNGTGNVFLEIK